jgi:cytochrome c
LSRDAVRGSFEIEKESIMKWKFTALLGAFAIAFGVGDVVRGSAAETSGPNRGAQLFRTCAACHSLEPERNLTGPSLAGLFGRKAGSLSSFPRYSDALQSSAIVWNDDALDAWLKDNKAAIPGNLMPFPGIKSAADRRALIDYLKSATAAGARASQQAQSGQGMMGGMGGQNQMEDLKKLTPDRKVSAITYCGDTYRVTTADGKTRPVWEINLRFETDSSKLGPAAGDVAILPAGMLGDRFAIVFPDPDVISRFVRKQC